MKFSLLKRLRLAGLALLAGGVLTIALAIALAIQTGPRLSPAAPPSAADVSRAREFLRANDPRRGEPGQPRRLEIGERELNLLLAHLALRRPDTLVELRLQPGLALLRASAPGPIGWLNIDARLRETAALPEIDSLRIGRLPVPAWLAEALLRHTLQRWQDRGELQLAGELVQHIGFDAQRLRLNYQWQADSLERALATLWPPDEQRRMQAYEARLGALGAVHAQDEPISLAALLPAMFALARERTAQGQPAAAENRAALLTLALHVNGKRWGSVMPAARAWPAPRPLRVTLGGREDFPMHLLVSAALALEGGGPLADAIGIDKELADTRGGSGFSFNDIAADRAGTRLGQLARKDPERLQRALVPGLAEHDFMPAVDDLPEFMSEQAFVQRYGGVGAPAYREMMAMIEARLDSIALLR
jgi:hypothetical protein